eukprot:11649825-Heterocapsa_arctica.AAC.1
MVGRAALVTTPAVATKPRSTASLLAARMAGRTLLHVGGLPQHRRRANARARPGAAAPQA